MMKCKSCGKTFNTFGGIIYPDGRNEYCLKCWNMKRKDKDRRTRSSKKDKAHDKQKREWLY